MKALLAKFDYKIHSFPPLARGLLRGHSEEINSKTFNVDFGSDFDMDCKCNHYFGFDEVLWGLSQSRKGTPNGPREIRVQQRYA